MTVYVAGEFANEHIDDRNKFAIGRAVWGPTSHLLLNAMNPRNRGIRSKNVPSQALTTSNGPNRFARLIVAP
jgi:hypothetical protein